MKQGPLALLVKTEGLEVVIDLAGNRRELRLSPNGARALAAGLVGAAQCADPEGHDALQLQMDDAARRRGGGRERAGEPCDVHMPMTCWVPGAPDDSWEECVRCGRRL